MVGRTFSDRQAGVHITPLARGATGTNIWMDVQVNRGAFPDNQPPVLQVEVLPTNAVPGDLVYFHATASDPDGDTLAYAWTFDDWTFSTNNLPWTFNSFSAGEHVVRCVVSDMKGGVASANAVVTIGAPSGNRITGVVLDPDGLPLEGVRVDNSADTNAFTYIGGTLTALAVTSLSASRATSTSTPSATDTFSPISRGPIRLRPTRTS